MTRTVSGVAPLLEREDELSAVTAAVDAAATGQGGALVVEGPAGIGKTRLLDVARATATERGYRVLTGRAVGGVWVQAFRPENEYLSSVQGVQHIFAIIAPLVMLLSLAGGYLLADRALRPVDAVTRLAGMLAGSTAE